MSGCGVGWWSSATFDFTGSIAGWSQYYGPGSASPVEKCEIYLNSGEPTESTTQLQSWLGSYGGSLSPAGASEILVPLVDAWGNIVGLADSTTGDPIERYRGPGAVEPIAVSDEWGANVTADYDDVTTFEPTISDDSLTVSTDWVGLTLRVDADGSPLEFAIVSVDVGNDEIVVAGDAESLPAEGVRFEIVDLLWYSVASVSIDDQEPADGVRFEIVDLLWYSVASVSIDD